MELSIKTTILFPPELYKRLASLARQRGTSLGDLVRAACEKQYGLSSEQDRLGAVQELAELALPVADPAKMKREATPEADDLVP